MGVTVSRDVNGIGGATEKNICKTPLKLFERLFAFVFVFAFVVVFAHFFDEIN
jgi:hypothetical protein